VLDRWKIQSSKNRCLSTIIFLPRILLIFRLFYDFKIGVGVDVYIVDTGIDTTHDEFFNTDNRTIKNVYNAYGSVRPNTDIQGHGTHVAGTVGGRHVGVAPNANLYGLKVLTDNGAGDSSDVMEALDMIVGLVQDSKNPSIVSMSLGGECDSDDCSTDSVNLAVETLIQYGIVVSVASDEFPDSKTTCCLTTCSET